MINNNSKCRLKIEFVDDCGNINTVEYFSDPHTNYTTHLQTFINFLRGLGYVVPDTEDVV